MFKMMLEAEPDAAPPLDNVFKAVQEAERPELSGLSHLPFGSTGLIYFALDLPVEPVDLSVDPLGMPLEPVDFSPDLVDELRVTPNAAAVFSSTVPVRVRLLAF